MKAFLIFLFLLVAAFGIGFYVTPYFSDTGQRAQNNKAGAELSRVQKAAINNEVIPNDQIEGFV